MAELQGQQFNALQQNYPNNRTETNIADGINQNLTSNQISNLNQQQVSKGYNQTKNIQDKNNIIFENNKNKDIEID